MIDNRVIGTIESSGKMLFRHCHADGSGDSLTKGARCCLNTWRVPKLRVSRRSASPLPELTDLLERQIVAGQMQRRIQQHGRVSARQYDAIAIRPVRIGGIVFEVSRPQRIGEGRERHRRSGMSGFRCLDGVHGKRTHGVDAEVVEARVCHGVVVDVGRDRQIVR